jgi:hypothetical protein
MPNSDDFLNINCGRCGTLARGLISGGSLVIDHVEKPTPD